MAFFSNYNGTTNTRLQRMDRLTWTLIYGGLIALVLGYFTEQTQSADPTGLYALGALTTAMGIVMIYLRSRMQDKP